MTVDQVLKQMKEMSSAQTKKTYLRHGAPENVLGVKVGDMKKIVKKIKIDHDLALQLFQTGIGDVQYLAGLIADDDKIKKSELNAWAKMADWSMVSECAVPWVAAQSNHAESLADKWIKSKKETIASSGWATWAGIVSLVDDKDLDLDKIKSLVDHVVENIDSHPPNRVRYTMNGFVISVGAYVKSLTAYAKKAGKKIGKVEVNVGQTACKVPVITDYIEKIEKMGRIGKKKKTVKC